MPESKSALTDRMLLLVSAFLALASGESGGSCIGYVEKPDGVHVKFRDTKVQIVNRDTNKVLAESEVAPTSGFWRLSYDKDEEGEFFLIRQKILMSVILRLIAPNPKWVFDTTEVISNCANDVIFNLVGLTYTGTVTSSGSLLGPAGVRVTLTRDNQVYETTTGEGGAFQVGPILPGSYEIAAKHAHLSLSAPIIQELTVDCIINQMPEVVGYQISGQVLENGKPIKGVVFSLFKAEVNHGVALSDNDGNFYFDQIAVGNYQIRASYIDVDSGSEFTLEPAEQEVAVSVDDAGLMSNFELVGMAVQGIVLSGSDTELANVEVTLDGQTTQTDENGQFHLDKVRPGKHEVLLSADDYEFDPVQLELTSQAPAVHTISPCRVAVCPAVDHKAEIRVYRDGDVIQTTRSQRCFYLSPGQYVIGVAALNGEQVHFTPRQISLTVDHEPIRSGLSFSRVYRPLVVRVACLDETEHCQPENIAAVLTSQNGETFDVTVTKDAGVLKVAHAGLSPGTLCLY